MAWEYSEKTKRLFLDAVHGKPGTHLGEIENPDGLGEHGSIACGDSLRFTFRVKKNDDPMKDEIVEARYLTFGCTSAIAASEALCVILEARHCTPVEALSITNQDIVDFLEGLPDQKIHCSVMGAEALEAAVFDWAKKRGVHLENLGIDIQEHEKEEEGRLVCKCFSLTEPYIRRKIKELNLRTIPEITAAIKAGGACMNCHHSPGGLQDILDDIWGTREFPIPQVSGELPIFGQGNTVGTLHTATADDSGPTETLSPYQFSKKVEHVLDKYIRPMLQRDGGDVEIVDIKGSLVYVTLRGACSDCVGANATLKMLVEKTLRDKVQTDIRVIQV
ncbi:MAG: iron-sulfur cluster assembly scaffold protein [Planctomycetia bacterium]|nr:iron-sulfur cluster assembly scaffold protein [Planctomycetia bacterium]